MSELVDQLQRALRARHYSRRTEQNYCLWGRRYIRFHRLRHPADMAEPEINAFVTHLAVADHVSAPTQTQALSALLFLYRHVLHREVGELHGLVRARTPRRLPVVLSRDEVRAVLHELDVDDRRSWLIASLLYGAGLRLNECLHLRVLDLDLARGELTVRSGKGGKDRATTLPQSLVPDLRDQLRRAQLLHDRDLADGWGAVELPDSLERKYPRAPWEWRWQWVFPQQRRWTDRRTGRQGRHYVHPSTVQRAMHDAVRRGHRQTRDLPHAAALLRYAPARERLRHPHHPGAPRPQGRRHHHDLHPRPAAWRPGGAQPSGRTVIVRRTPERMASLVALAPSVILS